jgi:hypothetical protein
MAREVYGAHTEWSGAPLDRLEQLVALVRADEREACAVIAETPIICEQDDITMHAKDRVAAAIRAREST